MLYRVALLIVLATLVAGEEEWKPISNQTAMEELYENCIRATTLRSDEELKTRPPLLEEMPNIVLCTVKAMGIFSEDSGYSVDRIVAQLSHIAPGFGENARELIAKCADRNAEKSPPEDWAVRGIKCVASQIIEDFFESLRKSIKSG